MELSPYHKSIVDYYRLTEHAYKDAWALNEAMSIHYGYRDRSARTFKKSLIRMNEIMAEAAGIRAGERVLDAGCGIGGSSIFLREHFNSDVTGISLSERQVSVARELADRRKLDGIRFLTANYLNTDFPDASFDVVWACESMCYADDKEAFIKEAWRLLRPGGRLVIADGFVTELSNNERPEIRKWLQGWQVNYLETTNRIKEFMTAAGFSIQTDRDITKNTKSSARRLLRFYHLARTYVFFRSLILGNRPHPMQSLNIDACKYQWLALKRGLWKYALLAGKKP